MSRFLFVVPPFTGHINPTLGVGAGLLGHKHRVAWASFDPQLKSRIPQGGDFFLIESDMNENERQTIELELRALEKKIVYGLESLKFLYEEILIPMNRKMYGGLRIVVDTFKPDVIVNDQQIFSAAVVALEKHITYATSITAPAAVKVNEAFPGVYKWESEQVIGFQKAMGISGEDRMDCSRQLSLLYTSQAFFGSTDFPGYFRFVGPVIDRSDIRSDFDWKRFEAMRNQFRILVSIGTTFDHEQKKIFFRKVVEAFQHEDIAVVVVSDPEVFEFIPDNFLVFKRVPQLKLLPCMDAVVCHGGYNTVCETLSNAKPLVVVPIAYDQSYVAGCVVDKGCGIRLNFNRFKPEQLKDATYKVLINREYAFNAKNIQQSFIEAGGIPRAVELLEDLLKK